MRKAALILSTVLVISAPQFASAGPNEEAASAIDQWVAALNSNDVERIVATYVPDATAGHLLTVWEERFHGSRDQVRYRARRQLTNILCCLSYLVSNICCRDASLSGLRTVRTFNQSCCCRSRCRDKRTGKDFSALFRVDEAVTCVAESRRNANAHDLG